MRRDARPTVAKSDSGAWRQRGARVNDEPAQRWTHAGQDQSAWPIALRDARRQDPRRAEARPEPLLHQWRHDESPRRLLTLAVGLYVVAALQVLVDDLPF